MTQLVFVHGVATRSSPTYAQSVENRNTLFRTVLFEDPNVAIHTPLWGDAVPKINEKVYETRKGASAFSLGKSSMGMGGGIGGGVGTNGGGVLADPRQSLSAIASNSPTAALDALFVELLAKYDLQGKAIPPDLLATFARITNAMVADERAGLSSTIAPNGTIALIGAPESDADLTRAVRATSNGPASLSIGSAIGDAVKSVTDRLRKVASAVAFDPLADLARPSIGLFLGDVFTYLKGNDLRETIRGEIREKLLAAYEARADGEKLVLIGHSMGGVILVDMLCSPTDAGLPNDFKVDVLLTVGSQPGLFQALGLFQPVSVQKLPKPLCVDHWYNVFDPLDPLAFRADPIFDGVMDLRFDSITGVASAHTTYFLRPQFYARARKRLQDCMVIA